jgi:enoyl-CoA hydratase/carnithine racemase
MTVQVSVESVGNHRFLRWHIHRPERMNAIGTSIAAELTDALALARHEPPHGVRALVITAETVVKDHKATWIAGGDLLELATLTEKQQGQEYAATMNRFCSELELLPIPVITFVDGAAIGGGAELAIAADIRLATQRSTLEFRQLKMGLATGYGAASRLCTLIGKAKAQELLYFCETLSAQEAQTMGLVHRILKSQDDIAEVLNHLANLEPLALAAQKQMLHLAGNRNSDHATEDRIFGKIWRNKTHIAMLDKFKEKIRL